MASDLEKRVTELEGKFSEWEGVLGSGDPVGNAQRVLSQRKAKLAEVPDPAKLTEAKIKEISGDDGSDDAENSANKDVAEGLKEDKALAKKGEKREPGQGGARG
jgi:hypothetical protein